MTVKDLDDDTLLQNMHLYNDQDAFTILFRRHWKPLYKTILAKTGDVEQADDIVQEIFVQLWERRDKINRIISLKGYLNGIAYNKVIDVYRYTKKQEDTLALLGRQAASVVAG